jgi:hypothetical protein
VLWDLVRPLNLVENSGSQPVKLTSDPIYRWRVGEIEIARVLEFEAALFEPTMLYPEATHEIIDRHRTWLDPC